MHFGKLIFVLIYFGFVNRKTCVIRIIRRHFLHFSTKSQLKCWGNMLNVCYSLFKNTLNCFSERSCIACTGEQTCYSTKHKWNAKKQQNKTEKNVKKQRKSVIFCINNHINRMYSTNSAWGWHLTPLHAVQKRRPTTTNGQVQTRLIDNKQKPPC